MKRKTAGFFIAATLILLFLTVWGSLPFFYDGVFNQGSLFAVVFFPLVILLMWVFPALKKRAVRPFFRTVFVVFYGLFVSFCLCLVCISVAIAAAALQKPQEGGVYIILGSALKKDDTPGVMLSDRLDAYLNDGYSETAVCIVSGGVSNYGGISQGESMRRYLAQRGIPSESVLVEPRAFNTRENLLFSKRILDERSLGGEVIIVTDGFHQFRSQRYAEMFGMSASGLCCTTRFEYAACYFYREILAVGRLLALGF